MVIEQVGIYKNLEKHAEAGREVDGAFDITDDDLIKKLKKVCLM